MSRENSTACQLELRGTSGLPSHGLLLQWPALEGSTYLSNVSWMHTSPRTLQPYQAPRIEEAWSEGLGAVCAAS